MLVEIVWSMLRSQKNCLSPENQKAKKRLSLEIWLSREKSCQKVEIQLIFDVMEDGSKFLTPDARTAFNHLWLAFNEALIF